MDSPNRRQVDREATSAGRAHPLLQETLLGEAAASMRIPFLVFGECGELIAVNDAACALTGWTRAELLARPVDDLAPDPAEALRTRSELLRRGRLTGSGRLRTRRGESVPVEYAAAATSVGGVPYLAVVAVPVQAADDLAADLRERARRSPPRL